MKNKKGLSRELLIVVAAMALALITAYIPQLSIFNIMIPAIYAVIGTITDNKYSILSIIITFFVLVIFVDVSYALSICIINAAPGIIVGKATRVCIERESRNISEPIYVGIIAFVISTVLYFLITQLILKVNLLDEFMKILEGSINTQISSIKEYQPQLIEDLNSKDLLIYFNNMLPMMLFLQGVISAFITYYLSIFFLKKMKWNVESPKFTGFYLPGNAVMTSFVLYLLVLFIKFVGSKLYTDLIMMNLQLVFSLMFIIQGIAVCIYYFRRWIKEGKVTNILFSGITLGLFGVMGVSFVGMIDSIIDFRKVRSYKST